jgi:FHS family L-fucose permease-like MFS transporter
MIMAIVGGAIMPYFMGALADRYSTALSYLLPLLCFAVVLVYGLRQRRGYR